MFFSAEKKEFLERKKSNFSEQKRKPTAEPLSPKKKKKKRSLLSFWNQAVQTQTKRKKNPFSSLFLLLKQYLSLQESETSIFKPRLQSKW